MTASSSLSGFHQWLLSETTNPACARPLMVHGDTGGPHDSIIPALAEYLNEYDDACDGRWLAATSDLISTIAADSANQRLLGLKVGVDEVPADGAAATREVFDALCARGHIVMAAGSGMPATDVTEAFHVGIGCSADLAERCHMTINPDRIERNCAAHIIGDVFLEWLNCSLRDNSEIRTMEEDLRGE
ncbi:MAG: hypothetical protein KDN05_10740 [Verrucomicrobiae bacterium]|nr:hypothetical protein [Verrucomicrobiae bacterium]MCP5532532.1 hypothetical protein [Akkermansiaceae bacterium]MCP5545797.1 hypothetical protein [Akkermansiaceae bacterium]